MYFHLLINGKWHKLCVLVSSLVIYSFTVGWWWTLHQNFKCTNNCRSRKYVPAWSPIHLYRGKGCCRSTHRHKLICGGDCNIIVGMLLHLQQGVCSPKEYVYIRRSIDVKKSWCFKRKSNRFKIVEFPKSLNS